MLKCKFLRTEAKDQIGRENKGSLKLDFAFILLLFHNTVQCSLHAPFLTFILFCSITHCSLHVSAAYYQHNAHSFNKQHYSPLMVLG